MTHISEEEEIIDVYVHHLLLRGLESRILATIWKDGGRSVDELDLNYAVPAGE
jgi:hypothetical protein